MPINPAAVTLTEGQQQKFEATANPVQWQIEPNAGAGQILPDGTYRAPLGLVAPLEVRVKAVPTGGSAMEEAFVRVVPYEVVPSAVTVRAGRTVRFTAPLFGSSTAQTAWQLSPGVGTLSASGEYTAPTEIAEDEELQLIARDPALGQRTAQARIRLVGPPMGRLGVFLVSLYLLFTASSAVALLRLWPTAVGDRAALAAAELDLEKAEQDAQTAARALEEAEKAPAAVPANGAAGVGGSSAVQNRKAELDRANRRIESAQKLREAERQRAAEEARPVEVWPFGTLGREARTLLIVLLAGVLGSFLYAAKSFVGFVGNRTIRESWVMWYLLYPLIGAALALVFYLVIRGGFMTPSVTSGEVNLYGVAAVAGLVGMFSKQATNKLDELFSTLFKTDKEKELKDKLDPKKGTSTSPTAAEAPVNRTTTPAAAAQP